MDSIREKERFMAKPSKRNGKSKSQINGYNKSNKSAKGQQNINKKHHKIKLRNTFIAYFFKRYIQLECQWFYMVKMTINDDLVRITAQKRTP